MNFGSYKLPSHLMLYPDNESRVALQILTWAVR